MHKPTHNILFTIPRTASNLLTQLLNLPAQPGLARHPQDGYFFLDALMYRFMHDTFSRPIADWADEERNGMHSVLEKCFAAWATWIDDSESAGKSTYIKEHINWMVSEDEVSRFLHRSGLNQEHVPRNPTCIPDSFLLEKTRPTFLIRHPALTFPSLLRTALDNEGRDAVLKRESAMVMQWEATFYWHRSLYTHLIASPHYPRSSHDPNVMYPIILDAADLADPTLVKKYAAAVGLDPGTVRFEWQKAGEEEWKNLGKGEARMKDTLLRSEGVLRGRLEGLDVTEEGERWRAEFGEVLGGRVKGLVERAMGDYWWLWERRMKG